MSEAHVDHEELISRVREELLGPSPAGEKIDCAGRIEFLRAEDSYGPYRQAGEGDEILMRDAPLRRYGVGVLFPVEGRSGGSTGADEADESLDSEPNVDLEALEPSSSFESRENSLEAMRKRTSGTRGEDTVDDFEIGNSNVFQPSSMSVSFLARLPSAATIQVRLDSTHSVRGWPTNGRYQKKEVMVEGKPRAWWLRTAITARFEAEASGVFGKRQLVSLPMVESENLGDLALSVEVFSRPRDDGTNLVTVCLINRSTGDGRDERSLFQSHFSVSMESPTNDSWLVPYPRSQRESQDPEELRQELLYSDVETYAVGHGCAADWASTEDGRPMVLGEPLPVCQTRPMTPDIAGEDGESLAVSMDRLARDPDADVLLPLQRLSASYSTWIAATLGQLEDVPSRYQSAAREHLEECSLWAERLENGIAYLRRVPDALKAFRLTNEAMLLQQARGGLPTRTFEYDETNARVVFSPTYTSTDSSSATLGKGRWRPFQIAFLVAVLESVSDPESEYREDVELVWFPTGGGKTEAYLGLAAYVAFLRRVRDPSDVGVSILMRYTLRLLTAQQFQRAATLICAMEYLRCRAENTQILGDAPFSIGMWLGGQATPNTRADAKADLRKYSRDDFAESKFGLTRCPWCGLKFGRVKLKITRGRRGAAKSSKFKVFGYEREGATLLLRCPDPACDFDKGLPVFVVDEDIYERRPTLVIGTVDKFAMLAWRPAARSLFGIGEDGTREVTPPALIIQDELHLISGPLGSVYGLYEAAIEKLCTDERGPKPLRPKLVCSTATIRRYAEQIRDLYARQRAHLFPAPALDVGDSFFARYAEDGEGRPAIGRTFIGVYAPGLGSMQTVQVRTMSAYLHGRAGLEESRRDPWWTMLCFFNSLRELGTTLSLFQSDIPDYLQALRRRYGDEDGVYIRDCLELTGRIPSHQVPEAIERLEARHGGSKSSAIDACLASNIIEVGIDIDRLNSLVIVGQPKTTAQYIQVSGRVGRRWWETPGLVFTLYGAGKPRDRSHFENFRSYHERVYSEVEPTSVTPFATPVLERALHAAMVAYVRQVGDLRSVASPLPAPNALIQDWGDCLMERADRMDLRPAEIEDLATAHAQRAREWQSWQRESWTASGATDDAPLLSQAGEYLRPDWRSITWPTQMSMRNVDAECEVEITQLYIAEEYEDG